MRSRTTVVMICLGLMLSLAALPAAAMEILQLTHGSVVIGGSPSSAAVVNVAGPRLSITTFQSPLFTLVPCGNGCVAGDLYEVGWHSVDWVGGGVTLDGVTNPFANASPLGDGLSISQGVLSFTAPSPIEAAQVVLTFPFEWSPFANALQRFVGLGSGNPEVLYDLYGLAGQGHIDLTLVRSAHGDFWLFKTAAWVLEPTPEPATLLLWGTGAAGVGLARWVKRRRPPIWP